MRHDKRYEKLEKLDKYELANKDQDIRGLPLVNEAGQKFGTIEHLLVDDNRDHVVAIELDNGRVCAVEPLEIHDNVVVYGAAAVAHAEEGVASGHVVEEEVIPVVEEKVTIGKRVADDGRNITVRTKVSSEQVDEDVVLRNEKVTIDRRPVNTEIDSARADKLLKQGKSTVTMTEHSEEAVVAKDAFVKEEVVVRKTAADKVKHVSETVRKTEVDVEAC